MTLQFRNIFLCKQGFSTNQNICTDSHHVCPGFIVLCKQIESENTYSVNAYESELLS